MRCSTTELLGHLPAGEESPGPVAWVAHDVGKDEPLRWKGQVVRLLEELDPQGRMARVLVEVDEPFKGGSVSRFPLLVGAFVAVSIEGRSISDAIEIPRVALHSDDHVWLVNEQDQLARQVVTVAWRDKDRLFISAGLNPGDRLVVSPLASPVVGTPVRVIELDNAAGGSL